MATTLSSRDQAASNVLGAALRAINAVAINAAGTISTLNVNGVSKIVLTAQNIPEASMKEIKFLATDFNNSANVHLQIETVLVSLTNGASYITNLPGFTEVVADVFDDVYNNSLREGLSNFMPFTEEVWSKDYTTEAPDPDWTFGWYVDDYSDIIPFSPDTNNDLKTFTIVFSAY